jgi:hypothetical protein
LLFGKGSKLEGVGISFFNTPWRSIITSELIGLGGSLIHAILVFESIPTLILLSIGMTPFILISVYFSQKLRKSIDKHQTPLSSENQIEIDSS